MPEFSYSNAIQLLFEAEYFLRRQLQSVNDSNKGDLLYGSSNNNSGGYYDYGNDASPVDPNLYSHRDREQMAAASTSSSNSSSNNADESSQSRGRTVLTILYLCVLALCFVVPVFYYFRLHCFDEHARRELELDFTAALEQSEQHREETRAARRKYIDERRARIVQLFGPVRMILKEENFPHLVDPDNAPQTPGTLNLNPINLQKDAFNNVSNVSKSDESATMTSEDVFSPYNTDDDDNSHQDNTHDDNDDPINTTTTNTATTTTWNGDRMELAIENKSMDDNDDNNNNNEDRMEKGMIETKSEYEDDDDDHHHHHMADGGDDNHIVRNNHHNRKKGDAQHNPYGDEDTFFIRIPVPGLPHHGSGLLDPTKPLLHDDAGDREMRLTPGICTICLSNYKVGSDIVWSSNVACDHHFHANCIEKWLMKQREGPLCPCCRRDFVIDPFDLLEEEEKNGGGGGGAGAGAAAAAGGGDGGQSPAFHLWDSPYVGMDDSAPNFRGSIILGAPEGRFHNRNNGDGDAADDIHAAPLVDVEEGQRQNSSTTSDDDTSAVVTDDGAPASTVSGGDSDDGNGSGNEGRGGEAILETDPAGSSGRDGNDC